VNDVEDVAGQPRGADASLGDRFHDATHTRTRTRAPLHCRCLRPAGLQPRRPMARGWGARGRCARVAEGGGGRRGARDARGAKGRGDVERGTGPSAQAWHRALPPGLAAEVDARSGGQPMLADARQRAIITRGYRRPRAHIADGLVAPFLRCTHLAAARPGASNSPRLFLLIALPFARIIYVRLVQPSANRQAPF
jgi:hypothetical protein